MESISIFDMIKIGIGPSSSHTMGPWRAALQCLKYLKENDNLGNIEKIIVRLYGSLAKTGTGHGTVTAIVLGLTGESYLTTNTQTVRERYRKFRDLQKLQLENGDWISYTIENEFEPLPFHPNGFTFYFHLKNTDVFTKTFYSVGGGFIVEEGDETDRSKDVTLPFPIQSAKELLTYCQTEHKTVSDIVFENEKIWHKPDEIFNRLDHIWDTIQDCIYRGCHTEGLLPGGLNVKRRAAAINRKLLGELTPLDREEWLKCLRIIHPSFQTILKFVSCFALATNEENADFGRIVTAPTNGASGVLPAVLFYYMYFCDDVKTHDYRKFLLIAGEIGSLFKKGATISAALGGCQAEIGVSSAMSAAALTECLGGTAEQALMAAEIAMEHHLGLTCDPIGGLVQIPCIERNSMGAIKAITAANIALESDPAHAKVSLDDVIQSMWETAQNMSSKYKETAEGGLALQIPVNVIEC